VKNFDSINLEEDVIKQEAIKKIAEGMQNAMLQVKGK